jgi:uncharacterized membrane protein
MSPLITVLLVLVIIGVVLYLINTLIPMPPWMKTVINAVAAVFVLIWVLQAFGLVHGPTIHLR